MKQSYGHFVFGSVALMSVILKIMTHLQRKMDASINRRSNLETGVSAWFGFSALLGENMRNESALPR